MSLGATMDYLVMLFVSAIAGMLLVLIGVLLILSLVDYIIWRITKRNDSEDSE